MKLPEAVCGSVPWTSFLLPLPGGGPHSNARHRPVDHLRPLRGLLFCQLLQQWVVTGSSVPAGQLPVIPERSLVRWSS